MAAVRRLIGSLCTVVFAVGLAFGEAGTAAAVSANPDTLSCSPAPCVLAPTEVSSAPDGATDAPMAIDPTNPARVIVGSNTSDCGSQSVLGFYLTSNGGSGWNPFCMVPLFSGNQVYIPASSPVLAYDRNGVAYVAGFYLDDNGRTSFGFEGFQKSSDGVTWTNPAPAVVRQDYTPDWCWMAADTSEDSPFINSVYFACVMIPLRSGGEQIVVTHSRNGGQTWQQVAVTPMQPADQDFYPALAVGKDGTVYLTWQYCSPNTGCNNDKGYMVFSKSSDGGDTWTAPSLIATVNLHGVPNTLIGTPDIPAIAVDNSGGPHSRNLYVVMYNWTGTFMQVQVARSTDGGTTWFRPSPVAPGETHDQFLPWISVSPTGLVGVSWLDRRNDPNNVEYQAFGAISADGGQSFQPNVQLTTGFSNPNATMGSSIGNYTGDTWDGPNYFLAAWMDNSSTGTFQDVVGGIRLK